MPYQPVTNFVDSGGGDLGKNLITKDYFLTVYPEILNSLGNSGLIVSPELWSWGYNFYGGLGLNDTTTRSTPVKIFLQSGNWKSISASNNYSAAIKTDGTLWMWGSGSVGKLGVNDTTSRSTPVTTLLGGTNWKSIACGTNHAVALKTDGTLWSWGFNNKGVMGVNDTTQRNTPVTTLLGGTNWKSISAGGDYTVALKTDGTLWSWGGNDFGQLGVNDITQRNTPVTTLLGGTNWKSTACGNFHTVAIKTDGSLWTWGYNSYGQLGNNRPRLLTTTVLTGTATAGSNVFNTTDTGGISVSAIYSSIYTSPPSGSFSGGPPVPIIISVDTNVSITFGFMSNFSSNYSGTLTFEQLGSEHRSTPITTLLGGTNWKSIDCGYSHTVAIKTDGTLWTWGSNSYGHLGVNDTISRSTPVTTLLGGINWKQVSSGFNHTASIKTDGTLWSWGNNYFGQLGVNNMAARNTPVTTLLGGTYWKSVSCGRFYSLAIQSADYF